MKPMVDPEVIFKKLNDLADPDHVDSYARFGIRYHRALGIKVPILRKLSKKVGPNQQLAEVLWRSDIHEAKLLALFLADPASITKSTCRQWAQQMYSWDLCDTARYVFSATDFGPELAYEWCENEKEYVKRTGFVTLVSYTFRSGGLTDEELIPFMEPAIRHADDDRIYVRKAISWLLRQMGKRSPFLYHEVVKTAKILREKPERSAQWIASDVLKELESITVQNRLKKKTGP